MTLLCCLYGVCVKKPKIDGPLGNIIDMARDSCSSSCY
jgi:hypothetical protein